MSDAAGSGGPSDGPSPGRRRSLLGVACAGGRGAAAPGAGIPVRERRRAATGVGGPRQGQWAEAEGHLRPLQASHASCGGVALGLARLRAARGDAAEAERLFERATSLLPGDALSHALFARYWLSRGQLARADYESSLRPLPGSAIAPRPSWSARRISSLRGRPQEAYQALAEGRPPLPGERRGALPAGCPVVSTEAPCGSGPHFEKAVALRPTDARALDYLALGFEALGEAEPADDAYRRALRVNDDGPFFDSFLDYNYGRFLLKERRLEESRSHLDRAIVLLPRSRGDRTREAS